MSIKTITDEKIKRNLEEYLIYGRTDNEATSRRYIREARKRGSLCDWVSHMEIGKGLKKNYSDKEIKLIAKAKRKPQVGVNLKKISFEGKTLKIAEAGDMHLGSKYFHEDVWDAFVEQANKDDIDMVLLSGDITDGFYPARLDAVLDLLYLGYEQQKSYAVEQLKKIHKPMFLIAGNHDETYFKQNGSQIVKDICRELPNATYLGVHEADIVVSGIKIKLWHGLDTTSRVVSARLQNLLDGFEEDELPDIIFLAHSHKHCYIYYRGVHAISGSSICSQSSWMRNTNKKNDTGFNIVTVTINENKIKHLCYDYYPCKTNEIKREAYVPCDLDNEGYL